MLFLVIQERVVQTGTVEAQQRKEKQKGGWDGKGERGMKPSDRGQQGVCEKGREQYPDAAQTMQACDKLPDGPLKERENTTHTQDTYTGNDNYNAAQSELRVPRDELFSSESTCDGSAVLKYVRALDGGAPPAQN